MKSVLARTVVELAVEKSKLTRGFKDAARESENLEKKLGGLRGALKSVATTAGGFLLANVIQKGASLVVNHIGGIIKAGSDLNETVSKTGVVFGDAWNEINKWSKNSAAAFGMSRQQALDTASTYGAMAQAAGLGAKESVKFATDLVGAAADLGSFWNFDPAQVAQDIRSGLAGEAEPLRKYNIFLNETAVAAKAAEMGLGGVNGKLTDQDKVLARQAIIMDQLGPAAGDFARTQSGWANGTRILTAHYKNLQAWLGGKIVPTLARAASGVNAFIASFQDFRSKGFSPFMAAINALQSVLTGVFGAKRATSITAMILETKENAVAGFQAIAKHWGTFKGILMAGAKVARAVFSVVWPAIKRVLIGFNQIVTAAESIKEAFDKGGLRAALGALFGDAGKQILRGLGKMLGAGPRAVGEFIRKIKTGFEPLDRIIRNIGDTFKNVGLLIQHIFQGEWSKVFEYGKRLLFNYLNNFKFIGQLLLQAFNAIPWTKIAIALYNGLVAAGTYMETTGYPWLWETVKRLLKAIGKAIGDIDWDMLKVRGKALLQGLYIGARDYWRDKLWPWIREIPGHIVDAFKGVPDQMWRVGTYIVQGLYDGLLSWWNSYLAPLISNLIDRIPKRFREALGIDSPSKVFAEIGRWSMLGIGVGFKNAMPMVANAMRAAASNLSVSVATSPQMSPTIASSPVARQLSGSARPQGFGRQINVQKGAVQVTTNDGKKVARELIREIERIKRGEA